MPPLNETPEPVMFLNCIHCLAEKPKGESPSSWARQQAGIGVDGALVIWCQRHQLAVASFEHWPDPDVTGTRVMCQMPGHDHDDHSGH